MAEMINEKEVKQFNRQQRRANNKGKRQNKPKQHSQNQAAEIIDTELKSRENPAEWYKRFPKLYEAVTNLYSLMPLGMNVTRSTARSGNVITGYIKPIPGIVRMIFVPTVGYSADKNSPINNTSISLFTYMRNKQRITGNFDWADLMLYIVAVDSAYMCIKHMERIYGVVKSYPKMNYYYAKTLLDALGISQSNFTDLINNLSDMRTAINVRINQINRYAVPNDMDFMNRHQWMCEGLYVDGTPEQAQTYVFYPDKFWKYDNTQTVGTTLIQDSPQHASWTEWLNLCDRLINALAGDDDVGFMSGAMKAVFDGKLAMLPEIGAEYEILPVYNQRVLSMIENAMFVGQLNPTATISQNPSVNNGAIIFTPTCTMLNFSTYNDATFFNERPLINFHGQAGPDDFMEATRWMVAVDPNSAGYTKTSNVVPTIFGTELMEGWQLYSSTEQSHSDLPVLTNLLSPSTTLSVGDSVDLEAMSNFNNAYQYFTQMLGEMSAFDWHFRFGTLEYATTFSDGTATLEFIERGSDLWDYDLMTYMNVSDLEQLHYVAVNSTFDIPGVYSAR